MDNDGLLKPIETCWPVPSHGPGWVKAECLRGLQIDDEMELGGCLGGQVAGTCPLEDAIHVVDRSAEKTGRNGFKTPTAKGGMGLRQIGGELAANNRR